MGLIGYLLDLVELFVFLVGFASFVEELIDSKGLVVILLKGYFLPFIMIDDNRTYYRTYTIWASRLIA